MSNIKILYSFFYYGIISIQESVMGFFSKNKTGYNSKSSRINEVYSKLKEIYSDVSAERKSELKALIDEYGYLPYPYVKALEELTPSEILFGLEEKWKNNGVFADGVFSFKDNEISVLARNKVKNSFWIQKEGHDIKLINLAGLGNGNITKETGKFLDWLRQLLILPSGNLQNNIFSTTIYLIPFHPREFGCAYLPKSSEVSEKLYDENIERITGMDAREQVQIFINLAQLAGHPVIYDILPQTGRFSKAVLANPNIVRWFDIKALSDEIDKSIEKIVKNMPENFDEDDVVLVKNSYKYSDESPNFSSSVLDSLLEDVKKELSENMMKKNVQEKLQKRARAIVAKVHNFKRNKQLTEKDITNQIEAVQVLMEEGLWPAPGGAWCSAGVPIYDKMSECGGYPTFKHYDYKGEDVTSFANLDCQSPYYFCYLENGTFNKPVIDYFINYMVKLQNDYNFDGFRVDHIDHIVDRVSQENGKPISYRAPRVVLNKLNKTLKNKIPYFGVLAEYMLWDDFLKEYHKDMGFDILWGNDIVSQDEKTPEKITLDNEHLADYNKNCNSVEKLSILKTYNNQDGEFRCINRYPGQLGENGALFKWFKYKFLPGGKLAQRSMMYVDGDESFTKRGIERVIGDEVSMPREKNYDFYNKFNAIDVFVKNNSIISGGASRIIVQDDDGFCVWLITKVPERIAYLVVANYKYTYEHTSCFDENDGNCSEVIEGKPVFDKTFVLPADYKITKEYYIEEDKFVSVPYESGNTSLYFDKLEPSEFRIYELMQ